MRLPYKTPLEVAQLAYETFVSEPERTTQLFGVRVWPGWDELSIDEKNAWLAVARELGIEFLSPAASED